MAFAAGGFSLTVADEIEDDQVRRLPVWAPPRRVQPSYLLRQLHVAKHLKHAPSKVSTGSARMCGHRG